MGKSPDAEYGDKIANLLHAFAFAISKESKASGVRIDIEFSWSEAPRTKDGRGDIKMRTFTTPDAVTERMLDKDVAMPRGSKLTKEALTKMRSVMQKFTKQGGK